MSYLCSWYTWDFWIFTWNLSQMDNIIWVLTNNNYIYLRSNHAIFALQSWNPITEQSLLFYCSSVPIADIYTQYYMKDNCRLDDVSGVRKWDDIAIVDYTPHDLKWQSHTRLLTLPDRLRLDIGPTRKCGIDVWSRPIWRSFLSLTKVHQVIIISQNPTQYQIISIQIQFVYDTGIA